jgi:hypothetical protein
MTDTCFVIANPGVEAIQRPVCSRIATSLRSSQRTKCVFVISGTCYRPCNGVRTRHNVGVCPSRGSTCRIIARQTFVILIFFK